MIVGGPFTRQIQKLPGRRIVRHRLFERRIDLLEPPQLERRQIPQAVQFGSRQLLGDDPDRKGVQGIEADHEARRQRLAIA
ncbi:MAG TPA: hypothetical protein VFX03_06855 [Thermomicrobiales bacterium]|nr:hypothetical protein [Thermomicrobiales bacterium]